MESNSPFLMSITVIRARTSSSPPRRSTESVRGLAKPHAVRSVPQALPRGLLSQKVPGRFTPPRARTRAPSAHNAKDSDSAKDSQDCVITFPQETLPGSRDSGPGDVCCLCCYSPRPASRASAGFGVTRNTARQSARVTRVIRDRQRCHCHYALPK